MKQKRKRKSLIRKSINWNYGLLTNILLIAGFLFYFGAVSLLTIGVIAAGGDGSYVGYTGYDDKGEVIYNMLFVNQEDQSDDGIVNKMYVGSDPSTASNLYIVPNSFIVQRFGNYGGMFFSNKVGADVYANILGGDNIEIFSDDITVLGGYDNVIYKGNDNSVLLGGDSNKILTGNDGGVSAVLLGGMENSIGNGQNGNVIIGGYRNEIMDTVSDSNIIGGENNKVSGDGVIVAGSNVNVDSDVDNVFVFSDNSDNTVFSPKSSNAFYLNVESGLGINKGIDGGTESAGVQSSGAVSVGEININSSVCNTLDVTNNIGVQGSWNGCMVGCTAGSASVGKWDLLDQSKYCKDLCKRNPSKCVDPVEPVPSNYSGYCSDSQPAYSVLCDGLNPSKWINTVFEVKLVDNGSCPGSSNINQCVYQCKTHYHLFDGTCKADCKLPWSSEYVKHNTVIQPYSATRVQCGPQGCNNRRTTLRCDDGKWVGGSATTYKYEHCTTEGYYSCQSDGYTFTSSTLANGKCTASCTNYNVKNNSCEAAGRYWKCSCNTGFVLNSAKTACVEEDAGDLCGSDNGKTLTNAPTALCNGDGVVASNPVKDETNGVWNWTCTKEGKEPQSCHANIKTIPNPVGDFECVGSVPAHALFINGSDEGLTENVTRKVYSDAIAPSMKCAYKCDSVNGYTYDESTQSCKGGNGGGYQCIGQEPEHAYFVTGSDEGLTENVTRKVYSNGEVLGKKCAYLCNEGYAFYNGTCYPCQAGTWSASDPDHCVLNVDCGGSDYVWDNGKWVCERVGICRYPDGKVYPKGVYPSNTMQAWSDVVPLNGSSDQYISCLDDGASVTKNSCTFSCEAGYYCTKWDGSSTIRCLQPHCYTAYGGGAPGHGWSKYFKTGGTPLRSQVNDYLWMQPVFVDVETESEFDSFVANNPNGCWFWCPVENRYEHSYGVYCYSPEQVAKYKEEEGNKVYNCKTEYHYGWDLEQTGTPSYEGQTWTYYSTVSEYQAAKERGEACIWTCQEGATQRQGYIYHDGTYSSSSNTYTCRKPCKQDDDGNFIEYAQQRCSSCAAGTMPNPDTSTWVWGQPTTCVEIKCPDGFGLVEGGKECGANNIDGKCPAGVNGKIINGQCVTCLDPTKTITDDGECI